MSTEGFTLGDNFRICFVAADSFGARSMATFITTPSLRIFIDPSVALGPKRYGLPPHRLELEAKERFWLRIEDLIKKADVIVITHYHYDHYNPRRADLLSGKRIFIKDPVRFINKSQRGRSSLFLEDLSKLGIGWEVADGKEFSLGDVTLRFSQPYPHGATDKLGYVLGVSVEYDGKKFLFTSDVQGPCRDEHVSFILKENPDMVYCDGPMTYMIGYAYSKKLLEISIMNLIRILKETDISHLVIDHHLTRDRFYMSKIDPVFETAASMSKSVLSAAKAMGREDIPLEAMRREIYRGDVDLSLSEL